MLRVSTSTLEQFRRLCCYDYVDEAELVAQIAGRPFTPSWQMEAGTAWHRVLSNPDECLVDDGSGWIGFRSGGYTFDGTAGTESRNLIGPGTWECKATRTFDHCGFGVTVVAQADHIRGLVVQDNKTKFSTPDARDYEGSLHWRWYLLVHEAQKFTYNLFDFRDPKEGYCELRNIVSFNFWTYAGIEADCRAWLSRFLEWSHGKNLWRYLERRSSTPEAA